MNLLNLLVLVIVLVVICVVAKWFVDYMQIPQPINWVILLVVGLLCLLAFLNGTGLLGAGPVLRLR